RWGGEEFVLVLPNTDMQGVRRTIARLATHGLGARPGGTQQTASVGLAERRADAVADEAALVALADARMYRAKQAGRNRVCVDVGAPMPFDPAGPESRAA